jgi:hypothetical protein
MSKKSVDGLFDGPHFDRKIKRFRNTATTISGIELMHRIRKGQFNLAKLGLKDTAAPAVWNAVLSESIRYPYLYGTSRPAYLFAPEPSYPHTHIPTHTS